MASNNQRTPSAPSPPRWSNGNKKNTKEHQQLVLRQVKELFDPILEPDIILSVVQNCKWKLQPSIDALIMLSETADTPGNQNNQNLGNQTTASFNFAKRQNKDTQTKSQNVDKMQQKSNAEQDTGFLNLNDKELQRQQEEFRKFERLKKDLTQKGFGASNENMSKFNPPTGNKISPSKLQQFSQNWFNPQGSTSKDDMTKGINSQINAESNPRGFVAQNSQFGQPNYNRKESKQQNDNLGQPEFNQKVTNPQNENLFGSKLQFSRDMPNKLYDKGTIPKNSQGLPRNPANVQSQQNFPQMQKNFDQTGRNRLNSPTKPKNFYLKGPNLNANTQYTQNSLQGMTVKEPNPRNLNFNQCSSSSSMPVDFNPNSINQEFPQMPKRDYSPQQVAQYNANYGNQHNARTTSKQSSHKGETESLCGLKVQYRLPGLENSSDDDADVVIEEEMTDYHMQIPPLLSVNVCQFLSSSTQSPPKNTYPELDMIHTPSPPRSPQRTTYEITFNRIISTILEGTKILIILRGMPGSGKSYLAKNIIHSSIGGDPTSFIFSADDYFVMIGRGVYKYDVQRIQEAHSFCQKKVMSALTEGRSPVIVDNTNTQAWELLPYAAMAIKQGYMIEVLEPNTPWAQNVNELAKKNSHGVPKDRIKKMLDRYEINFTGAELMEQFSLSYEIRNRPPQPRIVPSLVNTTENQENVAESDRPKPKRKKIRRRKNANSNADNTNVLQTGDPMDYLLNRIDQNVKLIETPEETSNSESTLDKDLSNTLMSDSDSRSKSLVDYSLETDTADDGDVTKSYSSDESSLKEKLTFGLLESNASGETTRALEESTLLVDPAILHAVAMTKPILDSPDNEFATSLKSDVTQSSENMLKMLQQSLGAIGSERKGSLTVAECEGLSTEIVDSQDNNDNVLSQCWDFTLLLNGTQIHSVGPTDVSKISPRDSMDDSPHDGETNTETDSFLKVHTSPFYSSDYYESEDIVQSSGTSSQDNHQSTDNQPNDDLAEDHLKGSSEETTFGGNSNTNTNEHRKDTAIDYNTPCFNQDVVIADDCSATNNEDFPNEDTGNENTTDVKYFSATEAADLEDADSVMAKIINKMDDMEIERNVLCDTFASADAENTSTDNDLGTAFKSGRKDSDPDRIFAEADEKYTQGLEADRQSVQERSTIGSIFSMIKNSLLGGQTDHKPLQQGNGNMTTSSNENLSHENGSSTSTANDYEDVPTIIAEDSTLESSNQLSSTTVGDTLTDKLSNTKSDDDCSDKTSPINNIPREISNPVICDTLETNTLDPFVNDTLSEKLLSNVTTDKAIEFFNSWANTKMVSHCRKSKSENDFEQKMQDITEDYEDVKSKTDSDDEFADKGKEATDYCKSGNHADSQMNREYKNTAEHRDITSTSTAATSESVVDCQSEVSSQENNLSAQSSSLNMFSDVNISEISDAGLSDIIEETLNETWLTIAKKNENSQGTRNSHFPSVPEIQTDVTVLDENLERSTGETEFEETPIACGIDNKEENDWIGNLISGISLNDAHVLTSLSDVDKKEINETASCNAISDVDSIAEINETAYLNCSKDIPADVQINDAVCAKDIEVHSGKTPVDSGNIDNSTVPNASITIESKQENPDVSNIANTAEARSAEDEASGINLKVSYEPDEQFDIFMGTVNNQATIIDLKTIKCDASRTDAIINTSKIWVAQENTEESAYNLEEISSYSVQECIITEDRSKRGISPSGESDGIIKKQGPSETNDEGDEFLQNENDTEIKNSDPQIREPEGKSTAESELDASNEENLRIECFNNDTGVSTSQSAGVANEEKIESLMNPENSDTEAQNDSSAISDSSEGITKEGSADNINWKLSPFPVDPTSAPDEDDCTLVTKSDCSTNTSYYDFNVLYVGGTSEPEYKIVTAINRSINEGLPFVQMAKPPLKLMLDKSSSTSEENILSGEASPDIQAPNENEKHIKELVEIFPNVSREDLIEIYEKLCNSDFNWTVDVLLDGVPESVTKYPKIEPPKIVLDRLATPSTSSESNDSENQCQWQTASPQKNKRDKLKQQSSSSESNDGDANLQGQSSGTKKKKYKNILSSEMKRLIEEKIKFNEASYHPHILRAKRWKNGEPDVSEDEIIETQIQNKDAIEFERPVDSSTDARAELYESASSPKTWESIDDFAEEEIEPEEIMELNLGEDFIKVLENEFGNSDFQFPGGLFPVIQIKKSMAQQLHALWIESMQQQLDAQQEELDEMIEKDAEYARALEQEEAKAVTEPEVPNLQEIMDMEMALAIYNNDMKEQMKRETPNDMASRLTRQMLHESFPQFDPETLNEILNAHNGSFKETVEILESSTGHAVDKNDTLKKQRNLIDRAKKESIQTNEEERSSSHVSPLVVVNPDLSHSSNLDPGKLAYDGALEEARDSRKEAQKHLLLRNENFAKATEAYRKGNPEVATYYSHMAKLHSRKMELANSTAASAFLAAQTYAINKERTLDLHNLYVPEALQALEMFLEHHIFKLGEGNKRTTNLYIITGRGARSANGLSKIKPAISKRLSAKNIQFIAVNPGCLKAVIHRNMG